jgi:hypothetical protein
MRRIPHGAVKAPQNQRQNDDLPEKNVFDGRRSVV